MAPNDFEILGQDKVKPNTDGTFVCNGRRLKLVPFNSKREAM